MMPEVISMLMALLGTVAVIVLTYYGSKWYARRMGIAGGGKHIKIIDRLVVSKTGAIVIIEVEGIQYMVGVSDSSIQILKQLEVPIPVTPQENLPQQNFFKALKTVLNKDKGEDEQ